MCYEQMTAHRTKHKPPDVSYASLDLRVAKKHKKKRKYERNQAAGGSSQTYQGEPPHGEASSPGSLAVEEAEEQPALPSRNSSLNMSRHSIYLNSQQLAQETQEMERERENEWGTERGAGRERERERGIEREME
ncbi:uncharacterized protein LOC134451952, partial [Engraulis encrasicolus]|uniref:uncharacterized protein LOC134451952 n=1 Tax=Engraulis encrasicolus TaxID=184585 RepID=UPI002FCF095F